MSRHGADEVSGSEELQARMRPAAPATMSADRRDRLIVMLNDKGWDAGKIGRAVGLTRRGSNGTSSRKRLGGVAVDSTGAIYLVSSNHEGDQPQVLNANVNPIGPSH
jgi:hypothetical protein